MTSCKHRRPTIFHVAGATLCLALSACGGGGGGGGGGAVRSGAGGVVATPANTNGTLTLKQDFTAYGMRATVATGSMMRMGQYVSDMTAYFVRKGTPLTVSVPCAGSVSSTLLTLLDRDGDGIASKGDRLTIAGVCGINGDFSIELNGATAVRNGNVEGDIQLASRKSDIGEAWSGGFHFAQSRSALAQTWRITMPAGVTASYIGTTQTRPTDFLRAVDISKTANYDTARATLSVAMVYEMPEGSLAVSTPTPMTGYLQRPPDAGEMQFAGANGAIRLVTTRQANDWDVRFKLTLNGGELVSQSYPWSVLSNDILWWDGLRRSGAAVDTDTQAYAADSLRLEFVTPVAELITAEGAEFRLQFLRPPIDLPELEYRFDDTSGFGDPGWNVPAVAERHGATVLLRPTQSLRHGRAYSVSATLKGVAWWNSSMFNVTKTLHDAEGHSLNLYTLGGVFTPQTLRATIDRSATTMASAAEKITLTANAVPATGATIAAYRWTQLNGTPLKFSSPNAAVTTVAPGDTPVIGVETIELQLNVTDSLGDTEATRLTIQVGDIVDRPSTLSIRGHANAEGRNPWLAPALNFASDYAPTRMIDRFRDFNEPLDEWDVKFGLLTGTLFAPGTYAFVGTGAQLSGTGPDFILQNSHEAACLVRSGLFTVLDVQYGADGGMRRLAIDYSIRCNNGPVLSGNYRRNSTAPASVTSQ